MFRKGMIRVNNVYTGSGGDDDDRQRRSRLHIRRLYNGDF